MNGRNEINIDSMLLFENWKWGDDLRYAYATGYIRSIEKRLISPERFMRLVEARSVNEMFAMLADTDYALAQREGIDSLYRVDVAMILRDEEKRIRDIIDRLTEDKSVSDLLFLRNDFFNIKLALKAFYRGVDAADSLSPMGIYDPKDILGEIVGGEKTSDLPDLLVGALKNARATYDETKNPLDIDIVIDSAMYRHLVSRVVEERMLFFYKLIAVEIDITNILSFFRVRWVGEPMNALAKGYIPGGSLPYSFFSEIFSKELEDVESAFNRTEYSDLVGDGMPVLRNEKSFYRIESLIDREYRSVIEKTRSINFGIEVLISYYYQKLSEMRRLRTVFIGKESGISPQELKMRQGYV